MSEGAEPGELVDIRIETASGASWTVGYREEHERWRALREERPDEYEEVMSYLMRVSRERRLLLDALEEARRRADEARWRGGPHQPLPRLIRRAGRDRIPK